MTIHDFRQKLYYVVYSEYGTRRKMEYNIFDFNEAKNKAMAYCATRTNRKAVVYSITQKDSQPKEEFNVNNQYVEAQTQIQEKAS